MDKKRKEEEISKENDKSFLNDGMATEKIKESVKSIRYEYHQRRNETLEKFTERMQNKHSFFYERYPFLFDMCLRNDFNFEHLSYFLSMRDKIINDQISSEERS